MKRTYMNPTLEVIKIETTQILAESTMTLGRFDESIENSDEILTRSIDSEDSFWEL